MDALFPPDRTLLFPQFETYRLQPLDPDEDVLSFPLPGSGATQSRVGYNTHLLSFSEVQSRIEWNHLAVGPSGRGMYVDADWNVVAFHLGVSCTPSCQLLTSRLRRFRLISNQIMRPCVLSLPRRTRGRCSINPSTRAASN